MAPTLDKDVVLTDHPLSVEGSLQEGSRPTGWLEMLVRSSSEPEKVQATVYLEKQEKDKV